MAWQNAFVDHIRFRAGYIQSKLFYMHHIMHALHAHQLPATIQYIHTYMQYYIHTYVQYYIHTYMQYYIHTYMQYDIHTYMQYDIHTYIHGILRASCPQAKSARMRLSTASSSREELISGPDVWRPDSCQSTGQTSPV
jgi:hypothetical protein